MLSIAVHAKSDYCKMTNIQEFHVSKKKKKCLSWAVPPGCSVATGTENTKHRTVHVSIFLLTAQKPRHISAPLPISDQARELMSCLTFYTHNITHGSS